MNTIITIVFFAVFAGIIYLGYKLITKKNIKPSKGSSTGIGSNTNLTKDEEHISPDN